jgi:hypothetical protein
MYRSNYAKSGEQLAALYEEATSERGYVADSFNATPAGKDAWGNKMTLVEWRWQLPEWEPLRAAIAATR